MTDAERVAVLRRGAELWRYQASETRRTQMPGWEEKAAQQDAQAEKQDADANEIESGPATGLVPQGTDRGDPPPTGPLPTPTPKGR